MRTFKQFCEADYTHLSNSSSTEIVEYLEEELSWNGCTVTSISVEDAKELVPSYRGKATTAIHYACMPGQSMCNEIKAAIHEFDHDLKVAVYRIGDTSRRATDHEYVIFMEW